MRSQGFCSHENLLSRGRLSAGCWPRWSLPGFRVKGSLVSNRKSFQQWASACSKAHVLHLQPDSPICPEAGGTSSGPHCCFTALSGLANSALWLLRRPSDGALFTCLALAPLKCCPQQPYPSICCMVQVYPVPHCSLPPPPPSPLLFSIRPLHTWFPLPETLSTSWCAPPHSLRLHQLLHPPGAGFGPFPLSTVTSSP